MNLNRTKLLNGLSVAILLGGASLAACAPEAQVQAEAEATTAAAPTAMGEGEGVGGEGEAGGGEGETGEAGAQSAYAGVPEASRTALRLAHLEGFILIAQAQKDGPDAAAALIGQGLLEVFDPAAAAFRVTGLDEAALRKAAQTGSAADMAAAAAALDAAQAKAGGDPAAVAKAMTAIASGLYSLVVTPDGVDPIEYQHSLGAALSARAALKGSADPRAKAALAELDRLIALWPAPSAPDTPSATGKVLAQAARVELALS